MPQDRRPKVTRVDVPLLALLAFLGLLAGAGLFVVSVALDARATVDRIEEEREQDRAVSCRLGVAIDMPLREDGPCFDPAVLEHYDPNEARGLLACRLAAEVETGPGEVLSDECRAVLAAADRAADRAAPEG